MEKAITQLVKGYETGGLTRRGLIRGLTMLFAGTAATPAAAQLLDGSKVHVHPPSLPWEPLIDHIQINSRDPQKSAEFYQKVLGFELLRVGPAGDERDCCPERDAFLGVNNRLLLAIRKREPVGAIDHWAMLAPGYDRHQFKSIVEKRGGTITEHDLGGQYVKDPDGAMLQLMGRPGGS